MLNIEYDSSKKKVYFEGQEYDFFCGETLTPLATGLVLGLREAHTLQELYTLMLQRISTKDFT